MIEDSRGNQYDGDLASLFAQMSSKVAAQKVPDANKAKDNSAVYKEISDLLKKLNVNLNTKDISDSIKHLNAVVNMAKTTQSDLNKNLSGSLKNIDSSLSKMTSGFSNTQKSLEGISSNITASIAKSFDSQSKLSGGDGSLKNITNTFVTMAKSLIRSGNVSKEGGSKSLSISKDLESFAKNSLTEGSKRSKNIDMMTKLAEAGTKPGSIYTHDVHQEEYNKRMTALLELLANKTISARDFERQIKILNTQSKAGTKFNDSGDAESSRKLPIPQGRLQALAGAFQDASRYAGKVVDTTKKLGDAMAFPNAAVAVFGGEYRDAFEAGAAMLKQERQIAIEAKKIAYETQGITSANVDAQKQFLLYEDTVARTGVTRIAFQKQLMEFQRKGIKDQDTLKNITTAQLNIEKQLGMETGELGDDFIKLHQQAGFTNVQINSTARGMLEVARQSGLSGKELKSAMESSKGIIENMKKAANLTAGAIKNVTLVMAEAQKLGVSEEIGEVLNNASSSAKLLLSSSSETKNLLYMAAGAMGRTTELQEGTLTKTKAGMKTLGEGMLQIGKRFGIQNVESIEAMEESISKMSDREKMQLNIAMKASIGLELDQFRRQTQTLLKGGQSYQDKLQDIESKLNNAGKLALTNSEIQSLTEQKLLQQRQASMDVVTQFDEAIKKAGKEGKNMNQIMEDFGKTVLSDTAQGKELRDSIEAATGKNAAAMTPQEQLQASMSVGIKQLGERLNKVGLGDKAIKDEELAKALQDPKSFRELTENMQKLEQEALAKEKATADPALQAELELIKVNEKLSVKAMELGEKMANSMNPMTAVNIALGSLAAEMALNTAATIANTMAAGVDLISNFKSWFKGGTKSAGTVADVAADGAKGLTELGKSSSFLTKTLGGLAKKLPFIGGAIDFGSRVMGGEGVGRAGTAAVSGVGGAFGGAAAGAAIGSFIPGIGTAIGGLVGGLIGSLGASELGGFIFDIKDEIFGWFKWLGGGINLLFTENLWDPMKKFFGWVGSSVGGLFTDYFWTPISNAFSWMGTTAIGAAFYDNIWVPIADMFGKLGGWLSGVMGRYWGFITWPFKKLYSFFGEWSPGIWKWIKSVAANIPLVGKYLVGSDQEAAPAVPKIPSEDSITALGNSMSAMEMQALVRGEEVGGQKAIPVTTTTPVATTLPSMSGPVTPAVSMAAMSKAGGQGGDMSGYLASIAKSGETEVGAAQQMIQLLSKMVEILSSGGSSGPSVAPAGAKSPMPLNDNYFKLPTGNFNESSIREVTNL